MSELRALSEAASRVTRFLDERAIGRGNDPEEIAFFNGHPLLVSDLRALVNAYRSGELVEAGPETEFAAHEWRVASNVPEHMRAPEPGLDVDRLARALPTVFRAFFGSTQIKGMTMTPTTNPAIDRKWAQAIATEYARDSR